MSFWSDLYAGDAGRIAAAFNEGRQEPFEHKPFVVAHVKLPGILPDPSCDLPNSLDLVTELLVAERCLSIGFAESLVEQLGGDPDPSVAKNGAHRVAPAWVSLFAQISDDQARALAARWLAELDPADETPGRLPSLVEQLQAISDLCRAAQALGVAVIYTWTL
jgi:hypothetical protein